jgi:predicted nucleic-acid-binding Zn-ribbon protein
MKTFWICTECNSSEYTGSISESDIKNLQCSNCGCDEFIRKEIIDKK